MNSDIVARCATTPEQRARELANVAREELEQYEAQVMDRLARGLDYAGFIANFNSSSPVQREHDRAWSAKLIARELAAVTDAMNAAGVR